MSETTLPLPPAFSTRPILIMDSSSKTLGTIKMIVIDGNIQTIATNQEWFWSEAWQAGERQVDAYIEAGEFDEFETMEEFLRTLGG